MQPAYNSPRIDKTCIDTIFTHQFNLPHLQRHRSQKDENRHNIKRKKFGFKKFKWRQKQFNKKIKITVKVKLDQNTNTRIGSKHKTRLQKYTKTYQKEMKNNLH